MSGLTAFGLLAGFLMLVCYALERRGPKYTLGFAGACVLAALYGFLQGAWPFGLLESIWAVVAGVRWQSRRARGHLLEQ